MNEKTKSCEIARTESVDTTNIGSSDSNEIETRGHVITCAIIHSRV